MPDFHFLLAVAAEFGPDIRDASMIGKFSHLDQPVQYGGRRCFPGRKDREDRVLIHLLRPGPVGPACVGVDLELSIDIQGSLAAAFRAVFDGLIQHLLNFLLQIHVISPNSAEWRQF